MAKAKQLKAGRAAPIRRLGALSVLLAVATASPALAMPPSCAAADHTYSLAQHDAGAALVSYSSCVAQAFARDDCTSRFAAFGDTQKRYAHAVKDVRMRCGQ